MKFKVIINADKCKECGLCVHFCEANCIELSEN
ncbi:MAG: 4Fe-4S binding protein, partial [Lentisphaerae bacterium]|nr:4Fe-4S binding protein [Lentisphaerota bacterium]